MLFFKKICFPLIIIHNVTNVCAYCKLKLKGGDRITELLDAVKALPDEMERIVKQEVSQLPGVLKALVQEIEATRGQSNKEVLKLCLMVICYMYYWCHKEMKNMSEYDCCVL